MRKQKSFIIITVSKQFKWVVAAVKMWGEGGGVATVNFTRKGANWSFSKLVTLRWLKTFYSYIWIYQTLFFYLWLSAVCSFWHFTLVEFWEICFPDNSLFFSEGADEKEQFESFCKNVIKQIYVHLERILQASVSIDYLMQRIDFSNKPYG